MKNRQKVLFFDIDGTLLDYDGRMPDSAREALERVKEKGHKLIVCSGRSKCGVEQLVEKFGFDGVVCSAGAYVEYRGQLINLETLTEQQQRKLIDFFERTQAIYGLQNRENIVCPSQMREAYETIYEKKEDEASAENEKLDDISKTFIFVDNIRAVVDVEKAFYYGADIGIREAERRLAPEFEVRTASFHMPDPNNGEISLSGVTKSYGMQKLLDYLQIERADTIAFGDGPNDFEMLEFAGVGVAMGNAVDSLKDIADYVTSPVNEHGILKAMKQLNLL